MKTKPTRTKLDSIILPKHFFTIKNALDFHYNAYNSRNAINRQNLDPLLKLKEYINAQKPQKNTSNAKQKHSDNIPYIALICALFAYGNVKAILRFLDSLDFSLLDSKEAIMESDLPYYRFQNSAEVKLFFLALNDMIKHNKLESMLTSRKKSTPIYYFINECISAIWQSASKYANTLDYKLLTQGTNASNKSFNGFAFLVGTPISNISPDNMPSSPLKRWNMFLRWLVRKDNIDLGLWGEFISPSELLLPLDTHTFAVCKALGILERKSYDFRAVLEVSENLAKFDKDDPIKYDFALYRLGQKGIIKKGEKVDFGNLITK